MVAAVFDSSKCVEWFRKNVHFMPQTEEKNCNCFSENDGRKKQPQQQKRAPIAKLIKQWMVQEEREKTTEIWF